MRAVLIYEPLLAVALVIPFRLSATEREMGRVVNDYAVQTAEECGDARHLFTDGAMDGPVEVAEADLFATLSDSGAGSKDIRVTCQAVPGIIQRIVA